MADRTIREAFNLTVEAGRHLGDFLCALDLAPDMPVSELREALAVYERLKTEASKHTKGWRSTSDEAWGRDGICLYCDEPWPCTIAGVRGEGIENGDNHG
jgi:hypothetical protein